MATGEKYYCLSCGNLGELTEHLRCGSCDSDNVVSTEVITKATEKARIEAASQSASQDITLRRSVPMQKPKLFRVNCGPFYATVFAFDEAFAIRKAFDIEQTWQIDSVEAAINGSWCSVDAAKATVWEIQDTVSTRS